MSASSKSLLRDALISTTSAPKGPPVVDGILSITPDTPEVVEWRRSALDITETTSSYLDDEDDVGPRPNELFGKFTWKIENFSEISKRELRSNVFDVGSYKWYILVYPQGCDVCNHLSLFLCVADYDKLLPGWSHFAQFTIAVVNKDPKKSKYSDTLHRFCKKEHDWGWKKFMELSKVLDGFTVADTLVIKAQVQVILDKPSKPFRCLDPQYRRELVRVYLTNVEGVCRRFCEDKRARLMWVKEEADKFREFWLRLSNDQQRKLLQDKADVILKALVKQFFNEKEVTSTLVMDALFSGCKQIEEHSRLYVQGKSADGPPLVLIRAERNTFSLLGDLLELADRVSKDFIPMAKDDKMMQPADGLALRSGQEDDYRRDSIESDEKRLAELGRKTVEMLVISHIITEKMEAAYRESEALKRQDQLIAEEFEMQKLEEVRAKQQAEKDKEKKAKKKEKMKAKKEAERAKKEAEDEERRRLDEARRLEQARKAAEQAAADRKKQEEELALRAKQQVQARQAAQQAAQQQQQKAASAKAAQQLQKGAKQPQAAAANNSAEPLSTAREQSHQQKAAAGSSAPVTVPSGDSALSALQPPTSRPLTGQLSFETTTGDGLSTSSTRSSSSVSGGRGAVAASDDGDSAASKEVGTVDQATGATGRRGDDSDSAGSGSDTSAEDDAHVPVLLAAAAAEAASRDRARAMELDAEVRTLRSRVKVLEKQLSDRDAEVLALRSQVQELQQQQQQQQAAAGAQAARQAIGAAAAAGAAGATAAAKDASAPASAASGAALGSASSGAASTGAQVAQQVAATTTAGAGSANHRAPSESDLPQGAAAAAPAAAKAPADTSDRTSIGSGMAADGAVLGGLAGVPAPPPPPPAGPAGRRPGSVNPYDMVASGQGQPRPGPHMNGLPQQQQQQQQQGTRGGGRASVEGTAPGYSNASNMPAAAAAATVQAGGRPEGAKPSGSTLADVVTSAVPSYRNAAAGGLNLPPPAPAAPLNPGRGAASAGGDAQPPVSTPSKPKQSADEPSTPNTTPMQPQHSGGAAAGAGGGGSVTVTPHMQRHLNHAAAEFTGGTRLMMQQQAAAVAAAAVTQAQGAGGLSFGNKRPQQQQQQPQMDSPGLDDFAHMGLIDDLLTE